ncbi:MAG: CPBP family intramembrane metalloprotease [Actinobacteria bacterium]|nr:CPBP family intramembrane metalloprotease [Actinomycetota bacterium]
MKRIGSLIDNQDEKAVYEISPGQYGVEGLDGEIGKEELSKWKSDGKLHLIEELQHSFFSDEKELVSSYVLPRRSAWGPLLFGIIGFVVFVLFHQKVFWQSPLNLNFDKTKAEKLATEYLLKIHKLPPGYSKVSTFSYDGEILTFLDQNVGSRKAQKIIDSGLPFQSWDIRWFKDLTEEEFNLSIDPASGRLLYYERTLSEDAPGARLNQKVALSRAKNFLKDNGYVLENYRLTSKNSERLKKRTDWIFEWELRRFDIKGAKRRMEVGLSGESITYFNEYIYTPEKWSRRFNKDMSVGDLMALISAVITGFLGLIMFGFFVYFAVKRYKMFWKYALIASLVVVVIFIFENISGFAYTVSSYTTDISYGVYLAGVIAVAVAGVVFLYGAQVVTFLTASAASQRYLGSSKSLILLNISSGKRLTSGFSRVAVAGYGLAGLMLGYVVLFYWAATKYLHAWSPAMPNYSSLLSVKWAWLIPLSIGLKAAIGEEILFRWFSIPLAKRYLKWMPLALLLPALLWAFGHSGYPVFPVYLRGIELTVVGLVMGVFFLTHGIESTMIAHFVFNAFLTTIDLFYISGSRYQYQGIVLMALLLIFLVWSIIAYFLSNYRKSEKCL